MENEVNLDKIMPKVHSALDKLLAKTDFDSLTVKSIAEEIGFSRQYFYRAFADKYALIVDLFEYDMNDFYIAGVRDAGFWRNPEKTIEHGTKYDLKMGEYVNAGIMVFSL